MKIRLYMGEPYVAEPILAGPLSVGISHVVNDVCLENLCRNLLMDAMGVGDAYTVMIMFLVLW